MARHLNLDRDKLDQCFEIAAHIISHAHKYISRHSSVGIETASLEMLGVEGEHRGRSFASLLVERLSREQVRNGACFWWGKALLASKKNPKELSEQLARGRIAWDSFSEVNPREVRSHLEKETVSRLRELAQKKSASSLLPKFWQKGSPLVAVRYEDRKERRVERFAKEWCQKEGIIGVVPLLLPTLKDKKIIPVLEGLSLPQQVLKAYRLGFQTVGVDHWSAALQGTIEAKRAFTDLSFVFSMAAKFGMHVLSNHASLHGIMKNWHLLANMNLYEQFAKRENMPFENVILSCTLQGMDQEDYLSQVALAQLIREMFSQSPLALRLFDGAQAFAFAVGALTEQDILEFQYNDRLPTFRDRNTFFKECEIWSRQTKDLGGEISFNTYGRIARSANALLDQTWKFLKKVQHQTLWTVLEEGGLVTEKPAKKGDGEEGVFQKSYHYWNPVEEWLRGKQKGE
ncbi:MAG: lysine 5,6-aminomutase subunit alpha [Deltaproteobacteria bacterium]|nr:lysine 5,6-aminomutase subunit alpha [Deltaproteobacteria bacterium]